MSRGEKKGFIIVTALVVAAALSIMIGAYSLSVSYNNQIYLKNVNSVKAFYGATAGVMYVCSLVSYDYNTNTWDEELNNTTLSISNTGDTITVSVTTSDNVARIRSTAKVNNITRTINCELEAVPGYTSDNFITKWKSGLN